MKQYFILAFHSIKNHGIKIVFIRFLNLLAVKFKRYFLLNDKDNNKKWEVLRDKYKGKRVFVIGNGPSLNETELFLLKNEYTICFNHFYLMFPRLGWVPTFFMTTDDMVIRDMPSNFNSEILPQFEEAFFPDVHPNNTDFRKYVKPAPNINWMHTDFPGFRSDLPKCGINNTVVNAALQVMAHLGFTEIYLLGVDASYSFESHKVENVSKRDLISEENDPNHFDPRYFGKGKKYHFQPMYEMVQKLQVAKEYFEKKNVKIINAGVGGKLELFERQKLTDILNYDTIRQENIFEELVKNYFNAFNFETDFNSKVIFDTSEKIELLQFFVCELSFAKKLIPKLIETHVALGPFQNKYVFVKLQQI